jgi:hypothetical protein
LVQIPGLGMTVRASHSLEDVSKILALQRAGFANRESNDE